MPSLVTKRSLVVGAFFAILFAIFTVYFDNTKGLYVAATQIAVLPYVLLLAMVLLINPACRVLRRTRIFSIAEIMIVFIMGSVSAGIATFGLTAQLMPVISSLFNLDWNNSQTEWDLYVAPTINENYFVSVPGLRQAANEYRDVQQDLKRNRLVYNAALRMARAVESLKTAQAASEHIRTTGGSGDEYEMKVVRASQLFEAAREAYRQNLKAWEQLHLTGPMPDRDTVLATYPALIRTAEQAAVAARNRLADLSSQAGGKVRLFRRGLPPEKRAYPGFFPVGDTLMTYKDRFRRLTTGLVARGRLRVAVVKLSVFKHGAPSIDTATAASLKSTLDHTIKDLRSIDTTEKIQQFARDLDRRQDEEWAQMMSIQADIAQLTSERRQASADNFNRLDRKIGSMRSDEKKLASQVASIKRARDKIYREMAVIGRLTQTIDRLDDLRKRLGKTGVTPSAIRTEMNDCIATFISFDASIRRYLVGEVPWWHWGRPLLYWAVILILTYMVLMAFNVLIFRQWAYNEKLTFPLAELPEILAGKDTDSAHIIPQVFRNGLFWTGFAISAFVLGWNLICISNVVPGLLKFDLQLSWAPYVSGTAFQGLLPSARSQIFFTLIGLAFLIPARISFSLWFFSLFYMAQLLMLVWAGHGVNENSFPIEWYYTLNFKTAEGGGALIIFSLVVMYKCRHYLLCFFKPASLRELELDEQREMRMSSFLFIFGSIALILVLWLGLGANFFFTLFTYFVVMMITIGMTRSVAEGGLLGFQAWVSPFHFIRTVFGMDKTWTAPGLFAPLMVYFSIMFLDLKTFIAPTMANCLKIRDDLKISRVKFHFAVILAISLAAVAAVVTHLFLAYNYGANNLGSWFYNGFPRGIYDQIAAMAKTPPVDTTNNLGWLIFGGGLMAALLYFRQFLFWLPHPIGLIMLVNPIMRSYWFSFFIGWLAKSLVTKYGNKDSYVRIRTFFIGLIAGELFLVILALIVSLVTNSTISIDLNRN